MATYNYTYGDIIGALKAIGVKRGSTVLMKTDLRPLGRFNGNNKNDILQAFVNAIREIIDFNKGTLVVSTASMTICNTNTAFDINATPSERGVLTEFIRNQKNAVRSFHPFLSYTALGKDADALCQDVSRHGYGPETPKARLLNFDTICVSVGAIPRLTCSLVHHVEHVMGVPYRYHKEFMHPVLRGGKVNIEPFYMYVWYMQCKLERDRNVKLFDKYAEMGGEVRSSKLGKGHIYSYDYNFLYKSCITSFKEDIYSWLKEPPEEKPYRL